MSTYGMTCYNCDEEVEIKDTGDSWKNHCVLEDKAKAAGWGMGLMASGQAYYSCPNCANGLYNFNVFAGSSLSRPHGQEGGK